MYWKTVSQSSLSKDTLSSLSARAWVDMENVIIIATANVLAMTFLLENRIDYANSSSLKSSKVG